MDYTVFIEQILGSETRVKILRTLLQEALPQLDLAALSRETGKSVSGVHKALKELQASRLIVSYKRGQTTYFAVDGAHASFAPLLDLFRDERDRQNVSHLFPTMWNHLESIIAGTAKPPAVRFVLLYGSLTRPPIYPDSDVDLFVGLTPRLGYDPPEGKILGHKISVLAMDTDALERKIAANDRFITSVLERNVVLYAAPRYELPWARMRAGARTGRRRNRHRGFS
ncbi:MAG: hypothetical protein HY556_11060 [Euryarchaeota archaeon]|nr:hypothetical protein [Euryarchaeota archaeon]